MKSNRLGKILRTVAVILIGLTAAMNILGGVGTSCAAFLTKKYPPMWSLLDYQWLYQFFVVATFLVGVAGAWTIVGLVRGGRNAYRNAVIVLAAGAVLNTIHVITSIALRGKATPADVVLYLNLLTLLFALLLGLPGIRKQVRFGEEAGKAEKTAAMGMACVLSGGLVLTSAWWAGPTHTYQGQNWVYVLAAPIYLGGGMLLLTGLGKLLGMAVEARLPGDTALKGTPPQPAGQAQPDSAR